MKVWEETWTADERGYLRDATGCCIFIGDSMGDGAAIPQERAKLAAKAPEMARWIMEMLDEGKSYERQCAGRQLLRDAGVIP